MGRDQKMREGRLCVFSFQSWYFSPADLWHNINCHFSSFECQGQEEQSTDELGLSFSYVFGSTYTYRALTFYGKYISKASQTLTCLTLTTPLRS